MRNYITTGLKNEIVCVHPNVEKYWEWGGMGAHPADPIYHYCSILLKTGEQKDFKSADGQDGRIKCNEYLNTIAETENVFSIQSYPHIPSVPESAKQFSDDLQSVLQSFSEICKQHNVTNGVMITIKEGRIFVYGNSEYFPKTDQ